MNIEKPYDIYYNRKKKNVNYEVKKMLCEYSYMTNDLKTHGDFQADTDDFKNFWKREHENIRCAVVKTKDEWYIFYRKYKKPIWSKVKGTNDGYQIALNFN